MIQAVIFDYDGVIVRTENAWDEADNLALKNLGVLDPDSGLHKKNLAGVSLLEGAKYYKEVFNLTVSVEEILFARQEAIKQVFGKGIAYVSGFWNFAKQLTVPSCIATACDKELFISSSVYNELSNFFEHRIYFIADVGFKSKPSPDVFIYAAKQMQIPTNHCLVIEDSPKGIAAAKSAGMKCVGLGTTFSLDKLSQADLVISNFTDLDLNFF